MEHPIMKCGHAANSMGKPAHYTGDPIPACVICECFEVAEIQPDFTGRKARCSYYGKSTRKNECGVCSKNEDRICRCERDSDPKRLAFFGRRPDKEFDEFYCGCQSWN